MLFSCLTFKLLFVYGVGCYGADMELDMNRLGWTDIDRTEWTQDAQATHSRDKRLENGIAHEHILAACLKAASVYY